MKKNQFIHVVAVACMVPLLMAVAGCSEPTSDDIQRRQQEKMLQEGTAQTGMPAIKNFRERKILKDILELRDQDGLVTYTYVENMNPVVVPGHTVLGGKFTYVGETIGYGIPYATQYTNPQKAEYRSSGGWLVLPQADPNGLFSPAAAEGTWVLMKEPNGKKVLPQYIESRISVFTFKFPFDGSTAVEK